MTSETLILKAGIIIFGLISILLLLSRVFRVASDRRLMHEVELLSERERRFSALIQHAADAILIVDAEGIVTYLSPSAAVLPGLAGQVRLGGRFEDLLQTMEAPRLEDLRSRLAQALPDDPVYQELSVAVGEEIHWFDAALTNLLGDPVVGGIVINLHSVTARKRAEQAALAALADAVRAREAETRFLANMSHELRTPLNAIIGFGEILRDEMLGPLGHAKYRDYTGNICMAGTHLLGVINGVLDYSKAEAGGLELEEEPVEIDTLVRECQRLLIQQAEAKHIRLDIDWSAGIAVRGDARLLRQALLNLIGNAIKYTPDDGAVAVRFFIDSAENLVLEVTDTGIGIAPEDIPLALSPFGRVRNTKTRHIGGLGLGLAITQHIVEYHNGRLVLTSMPTKGLMAQIILPKTRLVSCGVAQEPPRALRSG